MELGFVKFKKLNGEERTIFTFPKEPMVKEDKNGRWLLTFSTPFESHKYTSLYEDNIIFQGFGKAIVDPKVSYTTIKDDMIAKLGCIYQRSPISYSYF